MERDMSTDATPAGGRRQHKATRERQQRLARLLLDQGSQLSIPELQQHFGVSAATVRRDLADLSDSGRLVRVYGGAVPARAVESSWREKAAHHAEAKVKIAQFAATELVQPGDIVYIDAGTTTAALARQLANRDDITILVAGLASLLELADGTVQTIVLGGRFRRTSASFLGQASDHMLDLITPDVAFMGSDFLEPAFGANFPDLEQATFKSRIISRSTRSWFIADGSKLSGSAPFRHWTKIQPPTGIVTTVPVDDQGRQAVQSFRKLGCSVHVLKDQAN